MKQDPHAHCPPRGQVRITAFQQCPLRGCGGARSHQSRWERLPGGDAQGLECKEQAKGKGMMPSFQRSCADTRPKGASAALLAVLRTGHLGVRGSEQGQGTQTDEGLNQGQDEIMCVKNFINQQLVP